MQRINMWVAWSTGLMLGVMTTILPTAAIAEEEPCAKEENKPTATTPEKIRQRAQGIREYKQLLSDSDATTRLAALDTMLNSCDMAMRELAYEAGFASGDQAMRSLALKHKVLSASVLVIELIPPEKVTTQQNLIACCLKFAITLTKRNFATGEFSGSRGGHPINGSVSGLELQVNWLNDYTARLRLEEGTIMNGTATMNGVSLPARMAVR